MYESGEMYLETLYLLKKSKDRVKSVDIVEALGYSKSSVSRGVNILKNDGYITVDVNGDLDFTDAGLRYTESIYDRHRVLKDTLIRLGVDADTAEKDACRIEHVISSETLEACRRFNKMN